ncbi:Fatty aldehyde dehydrogenase [Merluccius polli]|uniref:Aldehyde dehydrogenase family 3 member A2 n=1 Tax=Merluccius polli TaxID=89951 RepID=A0AA47M7G9_MERPO|nr:Fatty aldehyde dehydrogenase [Merluccius polli]
MFKVTNVAGVVLPVETSNHRITQSGGFQRQCKTALTWTSIQSNPCGVTRRGDTPKPLPRLHKASLGLAEIETTMSREQLAVERARRAFCTGRSKPLENRIRQLNNLRRFLVERQAEIAEASKKDLNRSEVGIQLFETLGLESEIQLVIRKLKQWAAPRPVEKNLLTLSDTLYIQPEPLGVVLVIGAWNYPWAVTMFPLIGAIAAGNAAVVKPSEVCVHTAKVMEELLPVYLDKELYPVVTGGVTETQELLRQRFDHIVYTGNSMVGRIVMEAAAKHLTPVTLELGGKSPCYIDKHCDIPVACRRVTWGKYTNCGQTCIAPDYVLCEPSIQERVIEEMKKCIQVERRSCTVQYCLLEFYTDDPKSFPDYGRIINERHFKRVLAMTEDSAVAVGGDSDQTDCYIAPTILRDVKADSKVMQEEIFGPLLPIVPVNGLGEAISFINQREKPLVIYVFSTDDKLIKRVIEETSSGAVLANDCLVHYSVSSLPFGGVGNSGMGCYHGKFSFDQLSHLRSCMVKPLKNEGLNNMRYPPHTLKKLGWARFFLLKAPDLGWMGRMAALAVLVAVAGFLLHVSTAAIITPNP